MQIYRVIRSTKDSYDIDPDRGMVLKRIEAMLPADDDRIVHEGVTYEVQPDGTFNVPQDLGERFTAAWDSSWKVGANPFFAEEQKPKRGRKVAA